jgi:hypothetical protein
MSMSNSATRKKVRELLSSGMEKSDVFQQLKDEGANEKKLAYFIAAHVGPIRASEHAGKVNILVTLMFIVAVLAFLGAWSTGASRGMEGATLWVLVGVCTLIPLLFAFAFYCNKAGHMVFTFSFLLPIFRQASRDSLPIQLEPPLGWVSTSLCWPISFMCKQNFSRI